MADGESNDVEPVGASHSITMLIEQLRSPRKRESELAAAAIWSRYLQDLLGLARQHLSARVRRREDEEDILQNMYKSFCLRHKDGEYELPDRNHLWNLLAKMTRNKAATAATRHGRQRRSVQKEHVDAATHEGSDPIPGALDTVTDRTPTPEEAAVMMEELQVRLRPLNGELREIALQSLAGMSNKEIAAERGVVERTVERKLNRIREAWNDEAADDEAGKSST